MTIATLTMNPALDLAATLDEVRPRDKLRCREPHEHPGGGGINVARTLARLGADAVAVFPAGGAAGETVRRRLDDEGVEQRAVTIDYATRVNLHVREEGTGEQYRFVLPGAPVDDGAVAGCFSALRALEPAYLVASGSLPPGIEDGFYGRVATFANEIGARFVVDSAGPALAAALDAGVEVVKPNRRELRELVEEPVETDAEAERAVRMLVDSGSSHIVALTLGAEGALVASKDTMLRLRPPALPTKSAVGAGDSFLAGLTYKLAAGRSLAEAARFAVATGTATLRTPGSALCDPEVVEALEARVGCDEVVLRPPA